jgi:hypothetical protein
MNIKIELFSEWQCGSGLASGADVDLLAIKDTQGFPIIPGRTLKGLLADAAAQLAALSTDEDRKASWTLFKDTCFGKQNEDAQKTTESGCLFVANAGLGPATREAITNPSLLFRKRAGTAIDENGQAKEHTLRRIEVAIPMTLYAVIDGCPDAYESHLKKCLQWVKHLGSQRNRGFGRCQISERSAMEVQA